MRNRGKQARVDGSGVDRIWSVCVARFLDFGIMSSICVDPFGFVSVICARLEPMREARDPFAGGLGADEEVMACGGAEADTTSDEVTSWRRRRV
jgi:hypothetical protein